MGVLLLISIRARNSVLEHRAPKYWTRGAKLVLGTTLLFTAACNTQAKDEQVSPQAPAVSPPWPKAPAKAETEPEASPAPPTFDAMPETPGPTTWVEVSRGVSYRVFHPFGDSEVGPRVLHVVRIDPRRALPKLWMISRDGGETRTAAKWCETGGLAAAINAGMYLTDFSTHVGYLRDGAHVNAGKWVKKYQSALVWGARDPKGRPRLDILDVEAPEDRARVGVYPTVLQNLRLIKGEGKVIWKPQPKRWSEAAVAVDSKGRLLFLFSRSPYSMHDFSKQLLALPLSIIRAQHVEGGPEASLSIHGNGIDVDLAGSFETGFNANDDNRAQWPLPNIIGVPRKR
jgi:hypothetical protein